MNLRPDIRRGQATDLPLVCSLLESARLPTADLRSITGLQLWVLEVRDSLVGAIALERHGSEGLLRSLVITPEYRKRGYGAQLVGWLENDARAEGLKQVFLLTETAESFFRHLGYQSMDRRSVSEQLKQTAEFRSLCPASAVCMSKILEKSP